jgi:hypothetical protein
MSCCLRVGSLPKLTPCLLYFHTKFGLEFDEMHLTQQLCNVDTCGLHKGLNGWEREMDLHPLSPTHPKYDSALLLRCYSQGTKGHTKN